MRRTSWQDGVLGTNCPIPAKWNWTYQFQVKDQIGSYYYAPSINFQRASGGFGGFIITNRKVISLPFNTPDGDIVITIGDWYTRNHKVFIFAISHFIKNRDAFIMYLISYLWFILFELRNYELHLMLEKNSVCQMEFSLMAKDLFNITPLFQMELNMRHLMSIQVDFLNLCF